mmetsp:Transcript_31878/g.73240  ORF Transcript_31878/g.73240 Transcript_31878/m.73240 type:complete len:109 (-) Transcript_31878:925-1251(-)
MMGMSLHADVEAGIEADIRELERAFGILRCLDVMIHKSTVLLRVVSLSLLYDTLKSVAGTVVFALNFPLNNCTRTSCASAVVVVLVGYGKNRFFHNGPGTYKGEVHAM